MSLPNWLHAYVEIIETLSPESLTELQQVCSEQIEFRDPFNDTRGFTDFIAVMEDMFQQLDQVQFTVSSAQAIADQGYIHWTFRAHSRIAGALCFEGVSRVLVDSQGKICRHEDYWDASVLMEQIPLLGVPIRVLRKKMSHRH